MQDHTAELKEKDYKNFIVSLFAPPKVRSIILVVSLFDHEISAIWFKAHDPLARSVRFQWWREALGDLKMQTATKSPLLEQIKHLEIDIKGLNKIISLHEEISEAGFLQDQKAIDKLFMNNANALELILKYTDEQLDINTVKILYKISFQTYLLTNYFQFLEGSYLKPFSQTMIDRFSYNPDFVKDESNNEKLVKMTCELYNLLLEEITDLELKIVKPSKFLRAYVFNVKYLLKLLKKRQFDLRSYSHENKFLYLLSLLWNLRVD